MSSAEQPNPPIALGGIQIIIVCWVFTPLAVAAVYLRLWARRTKGQAMALNDWLIVVALIFNCGQSALLTWVGAAAGIGHHMTDLITNWPWVIPPLLKGYVAAEPLWITTNSLIKISILDFYIKVFSINATFKRASYVMIFLVVSYWVSTIVRMFFLCTPLAALWNPALLALPGASCLDLTAAYTSVSIINLVLDFIIFIMPMPLVWNLKLHMHKKIALIGIFALGFLVCIISGIRVYSVLLLDLTDVSYTVTEDGIWSTIEPCLGIVNACLPLLQPVGQRISSRFSPSTIRSKGTYGGNSRMGTVNSTDVGASAVRGLRSGTLGRKVHPGEHNFLPLDEETWAPQRVRPGWGNETYAMGALPGQTRGNYSHDSSSQSDSDKRNVQITTEWNLHHERV